MRRLKWAGVVLLPFILSACGGAASVCEKPQRYESSRLGKRIDAPAGLDSLQPAKELTIPDPSPRPPRSKDDPCLELPPIYRTEEG